MLLKKSKLKESLQSLSIELIGDLLMIACISQVKSEPFRNLILSHFFFAIHPHPFLGFPHSKRRTNHVYYMRFMC